MEWKVDRFEIYLIADSDAFNDRFLWLILNQEEAERFVFPSETEARL
jgi:hypothetical protein